MQFSVTFRHMEASEACREYAREKIEKVKKYFPDPIMAHVILTTERGYQHSAEVVIQLHNGIVIQGTETTEDMYSSIDLVMAKIERQVRRWKEKIRSHKPKTDLSAIPVNVSVLEAEEVERNEPMNNNNGRPLEMTSDGRPKIVKTQKLAARPLTVDEAVMQMNLLHNSFLVFRNSESGYVSVVYRRDDGNYGLIETTTASS